MSNMAQRLSVNSIGDKRASVIVDYDVSLPRHGYELGALEARVWWVEGAQEVSGVRVNQTWTIYSTNVTVFVT